MDFELVDENGDPIDDYRQVPHCDQRVLHAPGECEFCDRYPDRQWLREIWGINFTGHHETKTEYGHAILPCPSEIDRPLSDINQWDGNTPYKSGKINKDAPMFEGKQVVHDPWSRHVNVVDADPECPTCHGEGSMDNGGVTPWDQPIYVRCDCTFPKPNPNCDICHGKGWFHVDNGEMRCECTKPDPKDRKEQE